MLDDSAYRSIDGREYNSPKARELSPILGSSMVPVIAAYYVLVMENGWKGWLPGFLGFAVAFAWLGIWCVLIQPMLDKRTRINSAKVVNADSFKNS